MQILGFAPCCRSLSELLQCLRSRATLQFSALRVCVRIFPLESMSIRGLPCEACCTWRLVLACWLCAGHQ